MSLERVYSSNAERRAAYRARLAERRGLDGTGRLTGRLAELEAALADATRRAEAAEARAARAEHDAGCGHDLERDLAVALGRVADLEVTVAELRRQLAHATSATASPPGTAGCSTAQRAGRPSANRGTGRNGSGLPSIYACGVSLTVHLPEDLARRVTEVAEARHVSPEQVAIETISSHLEAVTGEQPRRHLAFAAIGSSGSSRGAAEADELLAEGFGRD